MSRALRHASRVANSASASAFAATSNAVGKPPPADAVAAALGGALACAVGLAQAALDAAVDYAKERRQFGSRIADFQGVSFLLADMATQVEAARALYLSAARLRDAGRPFSAQAALDTAVDYAKERKQFGQRIADFQGLSFLLADMATQVEAARELYLSAARRKDAGQPFGPQAAMSKLFATDTAMRVATDAVQVLGGYGYVKDFPAERYLREAKILQIVEGTNQVQRVVIGRSLTS